MHFIFVMDLDGPMLSLYLEVDAFASLLFKINYNLTIFSNEYLKHDVLLTSM